MDILASLRDKNPALPLYSVFDHEFNSYGRILKAEGLHDLRAALESVPVPETGNKYEASHPALEAVGELRLIAEAAFGGMEIQCGYCNGNSHVLNALEYHKCSELNYTATGLVLLLALPSDLNDGRLDSSCVKGFYLPPEVLVEIHPEVLHFAPCRIGDKGFNCLVVLEKGVNSPLPSVDTGAEGEEKLLWMRGKWMTCHPDSPQAQKGAYQGISGENIELRTL